MGSPGFCISVIFGLSGEDRAAEKAAFLRPTRPPPIISRFPPLFPPRFFDDGVKARRMGRGGSRRWGRAGGWAQGAAPFAAPGLRAKPRPPARPIPRLSRIPSPGAAGGAGTGEGQALAESGNFCQNSVSARFYPLTHYRSTLQIRARGLRSFRWPHPPAHPTIALSPRSVPAPSPFPPYKKSKISSFLP